MIVLDHGAQEGMWQGWAGGEKSGTEHAVPVGHVQSFDILSVQQVADTGSRKKSDKI